MSCIADDPRVRRMGDYLHAKGWRVIGIGLPGAKSGPPDWTVVEATQVVHPVANPPTAPSQRSTLERGVCWLGRTVGNFTRIVVMWTLAAISAAFSVICWPFNRRWSRRAMSLTSSLLRAPPVLLKYARLWGASRRKGTEAVDAFWSDESTVWRNEIILSMRAAARRHGEHGLWIANDWVTLPIAAEGVDTHGGFYVYDSHEFATEEYSERLDWAVLYRPFVATIEALFIGHAAVVTSVSVEITEALKKKYRLAAPTATLRNMPIYRQHRLRPTSDRIGVLYHGLVYSGRGLEETIASLPQWRDEFTLTIRGPGPSDYLQKLANLAAAHGVTDRVTFQKPIPAVELVERAAEFDIGMMVLKSHSLHNHFALPNKIFEYMMAGLALCVSNLPSMADVVRKSGAGVLVESPSADGIAQTINSLTRGHIDEMKRRALESAKHLHFEADAEIVLSLYESAWTRFRSLVRTA